MRMHSIVKLVVGSVPSTPTDVKNKNQKQWSPILIPSQCIPDSLQMPPQWLRGSISLEMIFWNFCGLSRFAILIWLSRTSNYYLKQEWHILIVDHGYWITVISVAEMDICCKRWSTRWYFVRRCKQCSSSGISEHNRECFCSNRAARERNVTSSKGLS